MKIFELYQKIRTFPKKFYIRWSGALSAPLTLADIINSASLIILIGFWQTEYIFYFFWRLPFKDTLQ